MNKMMCRLWLSAVLCGSSWTVAEAYQLTHRWSFNNDYGDAITGAEATKVGQDVTLADGQLVLSGNGHGAGSLNLGTGVLGAGDVTLEIWATQNATRNWARVFDCFKDTSSSSVSPKGPTSRMTAWSSPLAAKTSSGSTGECRPMSWGCPIIT